MSRCRRDALLLRMFYAGTPIYILACRLLRGKMLFAVHYRLFWRVHALFIGFKFIVHCHPHRTPVGCCGEDAV